MTPRSESISTRVLTLPTDAIDALRDSRRPRNTWHRVVATELANMVASWDEQRDSTRHVRNKNAVVYVPSYGLGTHVLRRAGYLAIAGWTIVLVVHRAIGRDAFLAASAVLRHLGAARVDLATFDDSIVWHEHDRSEILSSRETIHVFTGRRSVFDQLRRTTPGRLIGATGSGAILLSRAAEVAREEGALRKHEASPSCTRLVAIVETDSPNGSEALQNLLRRTNPSVVFATPAASDSQVAFVARSAGYTLVRTKGGRAESVVGLGRDPQCGWPGDYSTQSVDLAQAG